MRVSLHKRDDWAVRLISSYDDDKRSRVSSQEDVHLIRLSCWPGTEGGGFRILSPKLRGDFF